MRPILFSVFGVNVYGYGTMIAIGILSAVILLGYRAKQRGYNEDHIFNMSVIAVISGIIGGKLLFIITEMTSIINDPSILKDIGNGFVIYGAVIGGAAAVYFYSRRKKWNTLKVFDMVIPTVALAQGFGRIGCFFAGCCYGRETALPIGVEFTNSLFAPPNIIRYPTQIFSSCFDFLLALFLLWYDRKNHKEGRTFALYLIIYSIGRFLVEFLRGDPRGNVGALSTSQFISIFVFIAGIILFNIHLIWKRTED
ncbi:prolipoprotein diacylglyceryl transferase [Clostridium sp. JN-9]|uniref:prolipoprotein diacylglyceryl transferase n=1 Tax=Clostridium sp. JN-9 TaxID=2507159 RepID=UPI000FFE31CB|nr:prolipoprotein diacylglyceryl transferase [Clostridium sp. JN-9]QAT38894.1 prolipoprotein diacylglyceryl transferase [Clostridium sp. JN-9]